MNFGWRVPSYARRHTTSQESRALVRYFPKVEAAGISAIWVIDHLLVAPKVYSTAWHDPMITLGVAAGVTEEIKLGTAILCAPFRHPTITAKETATLDHLAGGGRVILGVGTGHDDLEFAAVGVPRSQRGRRTDEALELIGLLLTRDDVHYEGRFYSVGEGTSLFPRPERPIPIWIGGGSQVHVVGNVDNPNMAPAVLARIERHDGWICRSSGTSPEIIARDISAVRNHLAATKSTATRSTAASSTAARSTATRSAATRSADFTMSHAQWMHIVDSTDRDAVLAEQSRAYRSVMDDRRSDEDLRNAYLFGTIEEMIERIAALKAAGIDHLIINPLVDDPAQIDMFANQIMPNL